MIEATTISIVGGIIGIGVGYLASQYAFDNLVINQMVIQQVPIEPIVRLDYVLLSFFIAVGVGIISGTYPAIKASLLNPIDALRYE